MFLIEDIKYWKSHTPSNSLLAVLVNPNFHALICYRVAHYLYKCNVPFVSKLFWAYGRIMFSIDIDWRAEIGKHFMIIHGIGIVIGKDVRIGKGVKMYQGVVLGGDGRTLDIDGDIRTQPIIEDNVIIYTHACVLGPVTIGKNTDIFANVVINKDITCNSKVGLISPNIIVKEKRNESFDN